MRGTFYGFVIWGKLLTHSTHLRPAGKRVECCVRRTLSKVWTWTWASGVHCPVDWGPNLWSDRHLVHCADTFEIWLDPVGRFLCLFPGDIWQQKCETVCWGREEYCWTCHPDPKATLSLNFGSLPWQASASKFVDALILECSTLSNLPLQTLPNIQGHVFPNAFPSDSCFSEPCCTQHITLRVFDSVHLYPYKTLLPEIRMINHWPKNLTLLHP